MHVEIYTPKWTHGRGDVGLSSPAGRNFLGWILHTAGVRDCHLSYRSLLHEVPNLHTYTLPRALTSIAPRLIEENMATGRALSDRKARLLHIAGSIGIAVTFTTVHGIVSDHLSQQWGTYHRRGEPLQ